MVTGGGLTDELEDGGRGSEGLRVVTGPAVEEGIGSLVGVTYEALTIISMFIMPSRNVLGRRTRPSGSVSGLGCSTVGPDLSDSTI